MCGKGWRCTHKAVHAQGGAHTRWPVATAVVLLFKGGAGVGPRVELSREPFVPFAKVHRGGGWRCRGAQGGVLARGRGELSATEAQRGWGEVGANEVHGGGEFGDEARAEPDLCLV